jgi:predicted chitinase
MVTQDQLTAIGIADSEISTYLDSLNTGLDKYQISSTSLRIAHFFAQVLTESDNLTEVLEQSSGEQYEGRTDLGNSQPGDGPLFKGRGLIQLTGRGIYQEYSDYTSIDFVSNPSLLEEPQYSVDSACWFFAIEKKDIHGNSLCDMADNDDFLRITYFINGGFNGLRNRFVNLRNGYTAFQVSTPDQRIKSIADKFRLVFMAPPRTLTPMQRDMLSTIPNETFLQNLLA